MAFLKQLVLVSIVSGLAGGWFVGMLCLTRYIIDGGDPASAPSPIPFYLGGVGIAFILFGIIGLVCRAMPHD